MLWFLNCILYYKGIVSRALHGIQVYIKVWTIVNEASLYHFLVSDSVVVMRLAIMNEPLTLFRVLYI